VLNILYDRIWRQITLIWVNPKLELLQISQRSINPALEMVRRERLHLIHLRKVSHEAIKGTMIHCKTGKRPVSKGGMTGIIAE